MKNQTDQIPMLNVLGGNRSDPPPVWMMRQAGRYLPEYRKLRKKAGGFLDLVYDSETACEVTMQPVRRYQMDGAILFSDILIIPHALGQELKFVPGTGPVLEAVGDQAAYDALSDLSDPLEAQARYDQIGETVNKVRRTLKKEGFDRTALIGFAGAPWTVACYMVEGGGSREFLRTRQAALGEKWFAALIERVTRATIIYLKTQIRAGAQIVQIFDSWAGICEETLFERFVIDPTKMIVNALKEEYPEIPIIGFPRGAGISYERYAKITQVDALGLDSMVPLDQARALQDICPVQGNIDPAYLLAGKERACARTLDICKALQDGPHIFNLGHGVDKHTDPEIIASVIEAVRNL